MIWVGLVGSSPASARLRAVCKAVTAICLSERKSLDSGASASSASRILRMSINNASSSSLSATYLTRRAVLLFLLKTCQIQSGFVRLRKPISPRYLRDDKERRPCVSRTIAVFRNRVRARGIGVTQSLFVIDRKTRGFRLIFELRGNSIRGSRTGYVPFRFPSRR